jgi:hypothetical protein
MVLFVLLVPGADFKGAHRFRLYDLQNLISGVPVTVHANYSLLSAAREKRHGDTALIAAARCVLA